VSDTSIYNSYTVNNIMIYTGSYRYIDMLENDIIGQYNYLYTLKNRCKYFEIVLSEQFISNDNYSDKYYQWLRIQIVVTLNNIMLCQYLRIYDINDNSLSFITLTLCSFVIVSTNTSIILC